MSSRKPAADIRVPRQQRSRERVDAILEAARTLIVRKGSSGLKIQEIAEEAGVTAGSMYQYFPNKSAILRALAERYFRKFRDLVEQSLPDSPPDTETAVQLLESLLQQFFEMNVSDPVLRDIWLSISANRKLRDIDLQTNQYNAQLIFDALRHLFPEDKWPDLKRYFLLIVSITPSTIRLALGSEPEECAKVIEVAKRMISASMLDWVNDTTR